MISLPPVDLAIVALYFLAVLWVGFRSSRRRSGAVEYLLAGRSLTLPIFVMTLVSSFYGGVLGVGEYSYLYGVSNWVTQGVPYYFFAALFAFLLADRVRRSDLLSIPDKLESAHGRKTAILGSFLSFILMTPAPYVLMLATLLQLFTGWSLPLCLVIGTALTTVYLFSGGFRSDVNTNVLEFILMFVGFAVILPFAYREFGGIGYLRANLPASHLTATGGNSIGFVIVWFFIALWTFVDPAFHQRCYAAKSGKVARRGILVSILFWFLFDAMTTVAGLYARAALPNLSQPMMSYPLLAERTLPSVAKGLFYVGMLATIMSTLNTQAFLSAQTLGRDVYARMRGITDEGSVKRMTRIGLVVTALLSIAMSLWIPSVVKLWYTIGTVVIPGLLIPLVSGYFDRLRITPPWAFATMLCGWLTSLGWFLAKQFTDLPVEPIYPGLGVSLLIWGIGRIRPNTPPSRR